LEQGPTRHDSESSKAGPYCAVAAEGHGNAILSLRLAVGPKFKGMKKVLPGLHFLTWAAGGAGVVGKESSKGPGLQKEGGEREREGVGEGGGGLANISELGCSIFCEN
jgi:hypothetical protein